MKIRMTVQGEEKIARNLQEAAELASPEAEQAVKRGAMNIKRDWRKAWRGIEHAPYLPATITFDIDNQGAFIQAVVGPDKEKRGGALGNIIEYGTSNNAPIPGGGPALETEQPKFEKHLKRMLRRALGD